LGSSSPSRRGISLPNIPGFHPPALRQGDASRVARRRHLHRLNICAILWLFARAMNPCVVAGLASVPAQPHVRGVAGSKLSQWITCTVILDASTYRGHPVLWHWTPRRSGGHPARSSRKREAPGCSQGEVSPRIPLCCTACPPHLLYISLRFNALYLPTRELTGVDLTRYSGRNAPAPAAWAHTAAGTSRRVGTSMYEHERASTWDRCASV
jgi:hypothetical protein